MRTHYTVCICKQYVIHKTANIAYAHIACSRSPPRSHDICPIRKRVTDIRAIRLSRGLTLIDLALLTEIPARKLAELEYGMQRLDPESRARLAHVFDLAPGLLHNTMRRETPRDQASIWLKRGAYMVIAVMIGMLFAVIPILNSQASASAAPHLIAPE